MWRGTADSGASGERGVHVLSCDQTWQAGRLAGWGGGGRGSHVLNVLQTYQPEVQQEEEVTWCK